MLVAVAAGVPGPLAVAQRPERPQPVVGVGASRSAGAGEIVAGEFAAGVALGFGFSFGFSWGFAWLGARALGPHGGEDPGLMGAVTGFLIGSVVGSSLGVHLVARGWGLPARYYEAAGGALLGTYTLLAIGPDPDHATFWAAAYGLPALGAIAASTLGSWSRRVRPHVQGLDGAAGIGASVGF
jgi:hypothetical protein